MDYTVINETSGTSGALKASGVTDVSTQRVFAAESEVKVPLKRPRHTEGYKQEVVARVVELRKSGGEIGSYLRSKGVYWGTVKNWEKKMKKGNALAVGSKEKALSERVKFLEKELERTRKKLEKSELLIEFQKKISRLLEIEEESPSPMEKRRF
jgi:hypothetical protein